MREPSTRTIWQHPAAAISFGALTITSVVLGTWVTDISPALSLACSVAAMGLYVQQYTATAPLRREARESLILGALRENPQGIYGLDLAAVTGLSPGSLYPELERLQVRGLVWAWWGAPPADGGPRRRYYGLTRSGDCDA